MSASLVGSEMCIRDSQNSLLSPRPGGRGRRGSDTVIMLWASPVGLREVRGKGGREAKLSKAGRQPNRSIQDTPKQDSPVDMLALQG
eukprot:2427635-Alexandrium_andersonii.AAC.1